MSNKHMVFVYGTLKLGRGNDGLLRADTTENIGPATVKGLNLIYSGNDGGFPVAYKDDDATVIGELYSVDDHTKSRLDILEGVPYMYTRETTTAIKPDGEEVTTEFYLGGLKC